MSTKSRSATGKPSIGRSKSAIAQPWRRSMAFRAPWLICAAAPAWTRPQRGRRTPGCLPADDGADVGQSTLRCNNASLSSLTSSARFGHLTRQLRLKLRRPASYARADFVFSETNREARKALDDWPAWHGGCLALVGPEGSGKTHLAMEWASKAKASVLNAASADVASAYGRPVLL